MRAHKTCTVIENGKVTARKVEYRGLARCAICCKRCEPAFLINVSFIVCSKCAKTADEALNVLSAKLIKDELES